MNRKIFSLLTSYSFLLSLFFFTLIYGFISQYELVIAEKGLIATLAVLFMFDLFFIELILILLIGRWCLNRAAYLRIFAYVMTVLFMGIYSIQFFSFFQGKEFLTPLALKNIGHISLLLNTTRVMYLLIFLLIVSSFVFISEKKIKSRVKGSKKNASVTVLLIVIAFLLVTDRFWLPHNITTQRQEFSNNHFIKQTAPVLALIKIYSNRRRAQGSTFPSPEINLLTKNGFFLNTNSTFPLIRTTLYKDNPPFPQQKKKTNRPNIIIFFAEGFSARTLRAYNSEYSDLTPNLDMFAKEAMTVVNYYNHTAATYRGLLGQLCSLYPMYGGTQKYTDKELQGNKYLSLSNIFNAKGYSTIFFDAHHKDRASVDDLAINLGFSKVLTGLPLAKKHLQGARLKTWESLSDNQFFEAFTGYLQDLEKKNRQDAENDPFFMCLYNLGTHAFTEITNDGKRYSQQNNHSLDRIHNFDHAFGKFWHYFKNSSYSENTIIIFTADHCHYPEKDFITAFPEADYQHLFIDKIPLIIFDPTRELPETYDANYKTSLNFAPTLLHYLDFQPHMDNPFMGRSIFSKETQDDTFGIASFDKGVYLITDAKIYRNDFSKEYINEFKIFEKYITFSQQLEVSGNLWDPDRWSDKVVGDRNSP